MRVLVVGGGAREHALVWKLQFSQGVSAVYAAPGNAGISFLARVSPIAADDIQGLLAFARETRIDLTVVGPEAPLAAGIVDIFQNQGLQIFGPSQLAARIEASKVWAKEFMQRHDIPTARWVAVASPEEARASLRDWEAPVVLKADGLAGGKGSVVCSSVEEAEAVIDDFMVRRVHGRAGERLVIEEYLEGTELSVFALADGTHVLPLIGARDYKRLLDDDEGPNTGGMGGYAPAPHATPALMDEVRRKILEPAIQGLAGEGIPYVGVLYAGLMLSPEGPKVLEYNCRWGDPEAELILPLLKTDLVELMGACMGGRLDQSTVEWYPAASCGVVLASRGYPANPEKGAKISGLDDLDEGVLVFHGATRLSHTSEKGSGWLRRAIGRSGGADSGVISDSGRVLVVVATGPSLPDARAKAYANVERVSFAGMQFRTDIALEVGDREQGIGDREQGTGDRGEGIGDREQGTGNREQGTGDRGQGIGDREQGTGNREQGTGDRGQGIGDREQGIGDRERAAGPQQPIRNPQPAIRNPQSPAPSPQPPLVAVLMGSESDRPIMEEAVKTLEALGISTEVEVISAHRTPERVRQFARSAEARGVRVLIAGAGGAAHLPGAIAAQTTVPVIGVPIPTDSLMGLDSLLSMVQMPAGVPVATVAVGAAGARNAAYLAAAMLGLADEAIRARYRQFRIDQSQGELL